MHRLLIADDEPKIRRRLSQMIDWSAFGVEVVAFADNGRQALEKALEAHVDLCMVDVRMPGMNGLEMIQQLKQVKPGIICIIVSGHDEFEYAQRAVSLNVFDYLLKPIKSDVLERTVARAVQELEARRRFEELRAQSMELLHRRLWVLREDFLREILSGMLSAEEIHQRMDLLEMHGRRYLLAMIALEPFLPCDMRQEDTDFRLHSQILRSEILKALPRAEFAFRTVMKTSSPWRPRLRWRALIWKRVFWGDCRRPSRSSRAPCAVLRLLTLPRCMAFTSTGEPRRRRTVDRAFRRLCAIWRSTLPTQRLT